MHGSSPVRETACLLALLLVACGGSSKGTKAPAADAAGDAVPVLPDAGRDGNPASAADGSTASADGTDSRAAPEAAAPDQATVDATGADSAQPFPDARLADGGGPDVIAAPDLRTADATADAYGDVLDAALDRGSPPDGFGSLDQTAGLTSVTYTADPDTIFANPERGFYAVFETTASSYESLDRTTLQNLHTQSAVSPSGITPTTSATMAR
jgi:hypothetical protein